MFEAVVMDSEGWGSPSTMRLEGSINGVSVVVLVDSEASHNFISPQVELLWG